VSGAVLLGRGDETDKFNALALSRRWQEWLDTLAALTPHRDPKRDAYRLHNIAVAHEALAYELPPAEGAGSHLEMASELIDRAVKQNPGEKYFTEAQSRIRLSKGDYTTLAVLYQTAATAGPRRAEPPAPGAGVVAVPVAPAASAAMTNRDVIERRAAGLDDENLLAAIKAAKAVNFDLTPAGLKALLNANVSNRIIAAMRAR